MSTATETAPADLRQIILDAIDTAFWHHQGEIEMCRDCTRNPAGICAGHWEDADRAREYTEARKQIENSPGDAEVVAVFAGLSSTEGGQS